MPAGQFGPVPPTQPPFMQWKTWLHAWFGLSPYSHTAPLVVQPALPVGGDGGQTGELPLLEPELLPLPDPDPLLDPLPLPELLLLEPLPDPEPLLLDPLPLPDPLLPEPLPLPELLLPEPLPDPEPLPEPPPSLVPPSAPPPSMTPSKVLPPHAHVAVMATTAQTFQRMPRPPVPVQSNTGTTCKSTKSHGRDIRAECQPRHARHGAGDPLQTTCAMADRPAWSSGTPPSAICASSRAARELLVDPSRERRL